jgi:hypothetical protein
MTTLTVLGIVDNWFLGLQKVRQIIIEYLPNVDDELENLIVLGQLE